jgi:hypothetical protein
MPFGTLTCFGPTKPTRLFGGLWISGRQTSFNAAAPGPHLNDCHLQPVNTCPRSPSQSRSNAIALRFSGRVLSYRGSSAREVFSRSTGRRIKPGAVQLERILIAEPYRPKLLADLSRSGINSSFLFPDLDGLSSYFNWTVESNEYLD